MFNTVDTPAYKRLVEILEQSIQLEVNKTSDYDSPNWAHRQAHINGKIEAYKQLLTLMKGHA